jgi:sulfide:quinone oxidoreductase
MKTGTKQIVIVGGGFAGVEAAIALRKNKYDVTLVSNRDYFFIYPISIWIPTGKIPFDKSTLSLPMLAKRHGFKLVVDELVNVKGNEQEIELNTQTLKYDYLVLAIGADKMKHKGIEQEFIR